MGLLDRLLGRDSGTTVPYDTYDAAQRVLPDPYEPFMGGITVADPGYPLSWAHKGQISTIWRTQPNVRKVVDFIARNVATIPFHTFERISDTDRERVKAHPIDALMSQPRSGVAPYRFWHAVLSDMLLYDSWAAILTPPTAEYGGWQLTQVPSWRLKFEVDALRRVKSAWFWTGDQRGSLNDARGDGWTELDLSTLIFDHGYAPATAGLSPMVTLADILAESAEAVQYRRQVWANGARVPVFMTRPADAPPWSKEARQRFRDGFRAAYGLNGSKAGGVPLLEDGMKLEKLDAFTPQDSQDLEGRRLTAIEVAAAFHIAPELVGAQQGNYSNVKEYRQMLYRDSLGPYYQAIEQVLNAQLVPKMERARPIYIEANVESKLRGSFEEQAQLLSSAVGAPWMLRAEARGRMNLPEIDGADELVVPLNVLTGGQASPRDSGSQNRQLSRSSTTKARGPVHAKAAVPDSYVKQTQKVLEQFFARQSRSVRSRIGADDEWWDEERWNKELADDLFRVAVLISTYVGEKTASDIGYEPSAYNPDATLNYLKAVAERIAEETNSTTLDQLVAALDVEPDEDNPDPVGHVFELAETSRSEQAGVSVATTYAGFAAVEAARQTTGNQATKTWVVNSGNPRASHAAMDGETVPIDDVFSNGLEYPGSIGGGPDETAGCQCSLQINVP